VDLKEIATRKPLSLHVELRNKNLLRSAGRGDYVPAKGGPMVGLPE